MWYWIAIGAFLCANWLVVALCRAAARTDADLRARALRDDGMDNRLRRGKLRSLSQPGGWSLREPAIR